MAGEMDGARSGKCFVCGDRVEFRCAAGYSLREAVCPKCGATTRNRDVARAVIAALLNEQPSCLSEVLMRLRDFRIYEAQSYGPLNHYLKKLPFYISSDYFDDTRPGSIHPSGVRCEDIESLSFEDDSFDLVIIQDVLEHVRHPVNALREIRRVIKPGGSLIFTVPLHEGRKTARRVLSENGKDVFLLPAVYHADGLRSSGSLVRTDFGDDIIDFLDQAGFQTEIAVRQVFYPPEAIPCIDTSDAYRVYLNYKEKGEMLKYFLYNSIVFKSAKKGSEGMANREFTGGRERYIPSGDEPEMSYEHLHRYSFAKKFIKDKNVLDLACGEGYGTFLLSYDAQEVTGIDIDAATINHASSTYIRKNIKFIQGSMLDVPVEGRGIFDVVVCFEAIEHVEEQLKLLGEVKRLLRPGGLFIVSTPNKKVYSDEDSYKNPFHVKEFYFNEFKELLESYFGSVEICGQNVLSGSYIWPLTSGGPSLLEGDVLERSSEGFYFSAKEKIPAKYFVAVASDLPLKTSKEFILLDASQSVFRDHIAAIEYLRGEINMKDLELLGKKEEIESLKGEINMKDLELLRKKEEIESLEKTLSSLRNEVAYWKEELRRSEWNLKAVYDSKTWRIGQFYGRMLGVSSPIRTKLIPGIKTFFKKKDDYSLKVEDKPLVISESAIKVLPDAFEGNKFDLFFFPMINFSFRYQRPQQLATHFAQKGHRVFYLSFAEFLLPDSKEEFRVREIKENVFEVCLKGPSSLDVYGGKISNDILQLFYLSMNSLRNQYGIITAIGLVHNPFWTSLALKMRHEHKWKVVYDCLDDWDSSMFKGIGSFLIEEEKKLAKEADLLTVTAELLLKKWLLFNKKCTLVRNACDYEHFKKATASSILAGIKKPIIGFYGGIADWIDIEAINYAANQRKDWSFVLLGGIFTDVSSIEKLPNVHLLGNQPYEDMPAYLFNFDVCLIPFKKNKVTEAVDPVKMYEYFSLGKPVVARNLNEIRQYEEYLYLYNSREEFMQCVENALKEQDTELKQKRRKIAAANTWDDRTDLVTTKIKAAYKKATIIIVSFNNIEMTRLCIESVFSKTEYPNFEIVIIDNNSIDGTRDYLTELGKSNDLVKIILNDSNEGFPKANNQGIRVSTGSYIILLNNDTIVTKGWLTKFVNYLEKYPDIGLIGPVTNFCGNEAKIAVSYNDLRDMDSFAFSYTASHEGEIFDIKMLALFCTAMRREIIDEVGLLDESFGMGMFEDDDFSHRVRQSGYRVVCAEDIFIHHFGQAAFKKLIKTGEYNDLFNKNRETFEKKWGVAWEVHKPRTNVSTPLPGLAKTKEHWGKEAGTWQVGRGIFWLEHEEVLKRLNKKISGDPTINACQYLMNFMTEKGYKLPVERCLTLGCGAGELEREMAGYNFCLRHDAYDVAEKAIEKAKDSARKINAHILYEVRDINDIILPENTYDVIFGVGAVHHFERLEHIFSEVNKALKPNGIFFLNEYVGPSRFQWTDRQLEVINAILRNLPKKYKAVVTNTSVYKEEYHRPKIEEVVGVDPSEAIRSEEIVPLLHKYFNILVIKETGGAILHSLLTNIAGNFKTDNEEDMKHLKAIFDFEDELMERGELSSDFAVIIAQRKS